MFTGILHGFASIFFAIGKYVLIAFCAVAVPVLLSVLFWFIFYFCKGKRLKKRSKKLSKPYYSKSCNWFKLLLWDFPRRFVLDLFSRNPDDFDTYGVHIFAGEQGSGKTITAMHFVKSIKERNPCCKVDSNINIDFQDGTINDWTDILSHNNGSKGEVIILDEIQNWFSSNESKNFPPDMLTEITQQRKQRKIIVGTSQVFTRISKPIREQITLLYLPFTVFGCLTVVRVYKLRLTDDGTVDSKRLMRVYGFVHDDVLRTCYNTYDKVERLSLKGFQPRSEQLARTPKE